MPQESLCDSATSPGPCSLGAGLAALLPRRPWLVLSVPVPSGPGVCLQQPGTQSQGSRRKSAVKGVEPAAAGLGSRPGGPGASASTPEAQTSCQAAHLLWGSQGSSDPLESPCTVLKPRNMVLIRKADGSDSLPALPHPTEGKGHPVGSQSHQCAPTSVSLGSWCLFHSPGR